MPVSVGALSSYGQTKALTALLAQGSFSFTAPLYLALYTIAPTESGLGTEVTGGSYTRQPITFNSVSGIPATSASNIDCRFPFSGGSAEGWGSVIAFAICTSITLGNQILYGPLSTARTINIGDALDFPSGSIITILD